MRGRVRTLAEVERLDPRQLAFFLDVDGTLLEIAPTPDEVTVTPSLIEMLRARRRLVRSGECRPDHRRHGPAALGGRRA